MSTRKSLSHTKKYKLALSTIHTIYRLINSTWNLREFLLKAGLLILQILSAQKCKVILFDKDSDEVYLEISVDKERSRNISEVRRHISELPDIERKVLQGEIIRRTNMLAVPLFLEDVIGAIVVRHSRNKTFDVMDQEILMTLSEQLVMGIRNFQLYEMQESVILGTIASLVQALETQKNAGHRRHLRYFPDLAMAIAEELGVTDDKEAMAIRYAGLLHAVSMMNLPTEILNKPDTLSKEEFEIVKRHPIEGVNLIKNLGILKPAIPILLHHHERYDGKGYPSGLKGKQIPLGAKILAVLDAFEAMVFGRPYRKRLTVKEAIKELKKQSGSQFDGVVVEAFARAVEKSAVKEKLQQEGIKME